MPALFDVEWKPIKNTERGAIARHGKVWEVHLMQIGRVMIRSKNGMDVRWINENQITKEIR